MLALMTSALALFYHQQVCNALVSFVHIHEKRSASIFPHFIVHVPT